MLPVSAVQILDERAVVFVLEGETVKRRSVQVGVDGGNWLEIVDGVAADDEVVVAGLEALSDGAKVRVARTADPFTGSKSK